MESKRFSIPNNSTLTRHLGPGACSVFCSLSFMSHHAERISLSVVRGVNRANPFALTWQPCLHVSRVREQGSRPKRCVVSVRVVCLRHGGCRVTHNVEKNRRQPGKTGNGGGQRQSLRWVVEPHVTATAGSTNASLRRLTLRHHRRTMSTSWVALAVAR